MIIERLDIFDAIFSLLIFVSFIASPILSIAGIIRKKSVWLIASAVLVVPFAIYSGRTLIYMGFGIFLPLFQLGAAAAVRRRVDWLAWLFVIPLISIIAVLLQGVIILIVVIFIYLGRKLVRYLINSILKDNNRVIILFVLVVLFIMLNIITLIADESDPLYILYILFVKLPGIYLMILLPALIYFGRNTIRSVIESILKSNTKKNVVSFALIASWFFFINATFKHFFWDNIVIGKLFLSGPPFDRIILLLILIVFPVVTAIEIWNKKKNIADALLVWIFTVWIFTLISFPEISYSLY